MACKFFEMIESRWAAGARVCVGLDPVLGKIPAALHSSAYSSPLLEFNRRIIEATKDLALAYKLDIAFYSGGSNSDNLQALRNTIATIRNLTDDVPVILDFKRGTLGASSNGYVEEAFTNYRCDAVTVNPYMGHDSIKPFLDQKDKGIIVICRTSNVGASEFQDVMVCAGEAEKEMVGEIPFHQLVAYRVAKYWNNNGNCALVMGATTSARFAAVRAIVGDMPFLVPGIGTQGGNVNEVVSGGINSKGAGLIINSSSGVIFADDPKAATQKLTEEINSALAI